MEIQHLRTPHLTLRPLVLEDAETLFKVYQGEGVLKYFPNPAPPTLEKIQRFLQHAQKHWEQHGYGNWGIVPEGEKTLIGWAGLEYLAELNETEVGFLLARDFWGKGYATEAAQASLSAGFEHFKLDHIIALVHPENLASRRVLEKCGMIYQETIHLWGIDLMRYLSRNNSYPKIDQLVGEARSSKTTTVE